MLKPKTFMSLSRTKLVLYDVTVSRKIDIKLCPCFTKTPKKCDILDGEASSLFSWIHWIQRTKCATNERRYLTFYFFPDFYG